MAHECWKTPSNLQGSAARSPPVPGDEETIRTTGHQHDVHGCPRMCDDERVDKIGQSILNFDDDLFKTGYTIKKIKVTIELSDPSSK